MEQKDLSCSSGRLEIRPIAYSDYESWLEGFLNRSPSKHPYDQGLIDMSECTQEWFEALVDKHQALMKEDDMYIFAIFDQLGNHLGMLDIVTIQRANFNWGEIGYFVHNQFWRQGYAFEAISKILPLVNERLEFHRIEAHVNIDNDPSINLLKKVGFEYECTRKAFIYENGAWTDNKIFYINLD
ncbi:acetyltransferase [Staphylococcus auricularis]|uniref:N-acetyltransferase n=1 Tax=Staphylococcus auricularis TaxID=29379 RepID=A0AAP8PNH8_9STAP|nr:GNAT family N-acetyltransferase [Staphylococcus auricularis]PNZ67121.1 N-acetyltransferase [Staphylococcus auricularis]QPT05949.1 GNAT family N-acetyltransferase [Staphylococcus auricularis]BCU51551.1 acetyltransferase [Staphylococcus auricularis]SQJ07023.1 acetyltransferase [Staphylococcus auricularis]